MTDASSLPGNSVDDDLIPELIRRLARAEADLRAALPVEIDAFTDPATGSPILLREAQKALQESETRYRQQADRLDAIFLAMTDAIIVYNAAGIAVQANPAIIAVLGFDPLGMTMTEVYTGVLASHTDGSSLTGEEYPAYQALQGKPVVEKPFGITNATDYRKISVLASASPLFEQDKVSGVVAIWHDVTERELADEQVRFQAHLLDTVGQSVVATDLQGKVTYWNRFAEVLYGWSAAEAVERNFAELVVSHRTPEQAAEMMARLRNGENWNAEFVIERRDGTPFPARVTNSPIHNVSGTLIGIIRLSSDISERKVVEAALYHAQAAEHEQRIFAEALRDITLTQINNTDRDVVLKRILDNVDRVVAHDAANIMLIQGDTVSVVLSSGKMPAKSVFDMRPVSLKEVPSLSRILLTGEALVVSDTRLYPEWVDLRGDSFVCSYVSSPIRVHGQIIGFLNLDSGTPGFFTAAHAERLQAFANEAAIAIENAQLYDQLQRHALGLEERVEQRTQELQAAKDRVESILNNTGDAILLLNNNFAIEQSNPAFDTLFGYSHDEIFNKPLTLIAEPDMVQTVQTMLQQVIQSREPVRIELLARRKDHSTFSADIAIAAIQVLGMAASGVICSVRDNTPQKHLEQELRSALEQEKELGQLKSRLVSMASHEFRTPLTTIQSSGGLIELYLDRMPDTTLPPELDKHFRKIEIAVKRMTEMLDEVLTIGKGDAGLLDFKPEPLDLEQLCQNLVQEVQLTASPGPSVIFSHSGSCDDILMDKELLQHILVNLLMNAVKYSPGGGQVLFEATCEVGSVTFRVQDGGLGIPEKDQDRLFEAFHRAANVGNISGTGLGLAIVKRAVAAHHGTISFTSQVGVGTTFTVAIPIFEEVSR